MTERAPRPPLQQLAEAHGIELEHGDWRGSGRQVGGATLVAVLAALGVDATTPEAVKRSLAAARAGGGHVVPPTVVAWSDGPAPPVPVRAPAGVEVTARLVLQNGGERALSLTEPVGPPAAGPDPSVALRQAALPADLPLGWHAVEVRVDGSVSRSTLVSAPSRLDWPLGAGARGWGWSVQLYQARSARSWGMGDYHDLGDVAAASAATGADLVVCSPVHAVTPVSPVERSPYYPSSRRFHNLLHLRVEDVPEYREAPARVRDQVDELGAAMAGPVDAIDRDAVLAAKLSALLALHRVGAALDRVAAFAAYEQEQGEALGRFALWSALAEQHGPAWRDWPVELRRPETAAASTVAHKLAERVHFHAWVQFLCAEQLAAAQARARAAGMRIGVLHDLAVGTDPDGADGWAMQDVVAPAITIGAPPDEFNQLGQDWRLPAWRPDRLAETGYATLRDLVRSTVRTSGGLRVDHVMGFWRLWWIPAGSRPDQGAYVRYDGDAMLATLLLEAHRAKAVVVGEDLGTVDPAVRDRLGRAGVLGCSVLWFERDGDRRKRPAAWRERSVGSVSTHDLPTAAGFLRGEQVRVRARLGLLSGTEDEERAWAASERAALVAMLVEEGLLPADRVDDERAVVVAMYAALAATPCRLVVASLADVVGDERQPNLPGTVDEYPNWRLPLSVAEPAGRRPVLLDELLAGPRVAEVVAVLARVLTVAVADPSRGRASRPATGPTTFGADGSASGPEAR